MSKPEETKSEMVKRCYPKVKELPLSSLTELYFVGIPKLENRT